MIIDIMFNCVPLIHRHYIFTFAILSGYAAYVELVEPKLYNVKHYTLYVLGVSMIVQIVFSTLTRVKLSFMGNPYDKILTTIHLDGGMHDEADH